MAGAFDELGRFKMAGYQKQRPFSSFLPGIAGPLGVPLWAFYANRGQAITSFGVEDKDHPILEFQPANKAYQNVASQGFRTFLRLRQAGQARIYEPFSAWDEAADTRRDMHIGMNELELEEDAPAQGLQTSVLYFTLPGQPFPALVRQLSLRNAGSALLELELLDGLPAVIPYGLNNFFLKEMSRTIEAWMEVVLRAGQAPFFRLRASPGDSSEVQAVEKGFFALSFVDGAAVPLPALVDPRLVFGSDTAFYRPQRFQQEGLAGLLEAFQATCGQTPCAFSALSVTLEPGQSLRLNSAFGLAQNLESLPAIQSTLLEPGCLERARQQAATLARTLTDPAECRTASPLFDAYARQSFLDNLLRGGWPVLLGDESHPAVYHLYSRKHGDPERDYNAFFLAAEYYSQGNGNYRDVNQNRRSDVLFNPQVGDYNIRTFLSLVQPDGYNPLVVKGSRFSLPAERLPELLGLAANPEKLASLLSHPFTPGELLTIAADPSTGLALPPEDFLNRAIAASQQHIEAEFGEGYWIDHWLYTLDLLDSYLALYPERKEDLLYGEPGLPWFDSPAGVEPRSRKTVQVGERVFQLNAVRKDPEKQARIAARPSLPNWVRSRGDERIILRSSVFAKLTALTLLKFITLDPLGMGVEMEAGKPGWYDALNGLPALFGSSLNENLALQRLLSFMLQAMAEKPGGEVRLPVELAELLEQAHAALQTWQIGELDDFRLWDALSSARETYRERVRLGLSGEERSLPFSTLLVPLGDFLRKARSGVQRAIQLNHGELPTYFTFHAMDCEPRLAENGKPLLDPQGRPCLRVTRFEARPLPLFLEGYVHALNVQPDPASARLLHQAVMAGPLYDRKLGMLRVNASLQEQGHEIGRARAFPPGWLENESIWLHMEYKYLLALLRAGLYDEFYALFQQTLVPFLDPVIYGRSPLENSSFIASSAHPDASLHGAGFVARLTGATAEFLSMWNIMMAGPRPFTCPGEALRLELRPALPGWLFPQDGELSFRFLGACTVTYHNPGRLPTFSPQAALPQRCRLTYRDGRSCELPGSEIPSPHAEAVRQGQVCQLDVYYA